MTNTSKITLGQWKIIAETGELYWSDQVFDIYGIEIGGEIDIETTIKAYQPEDRELISANVTRAPEENKIFSLIYVYLKQTARYVPSKQLVLFDYFRTVMSVLCLARFKT